MLSLPRPRPPFAILVAAVLAMTGCGSDDASPPSPVPGGGTVSTPPAPNPMLQSFGFAAIDCDLDDPFDGDGTTDFSAEVSGFSNANQVCPTGDETIDAARLQAAAASFTPVFTVEPVFFENTSAGARPFAGRDVLWEQIKRSIAQSEVDPAQIIFYLVDEPFLRGLTQAQVEDAAGIIAADFPDSPILLIQAYSGTSDPIVPASVDIWGFNAYAIPDPLAEPLYTGFLDRAVAQFSAGQSLAIVGDGIHTQFHTDAGLSEADMADVAGRYLALADSYPQTSLLIVYSWPGGVEGPGEKGVRNLPGEVAAAWEAIGREILSR